MYWLFNNSFFNVRGPRVVLEWPQKRTFRGNEGDKVILFEFNRQRHLFTTLYKITRVNKGSPENNLNVNFISIILQQERDFGERKEIEDYIYIASQE